jgi:hypothetical protein
MKMFTIEKNRRVGFSLMLVCLLAGLPLAAEDVRPEEKKPDANASFREYELGQPLDRFPALKPRRPGNASHIKADEDGCEFYGLPEDIEIGNFLISKNDIYFVFYQRRLLRIRIMNSFHGRDDRDLAFFQAMRTALTEKFGNASAKGDILMRYDGEYEWKTEVMRISLQYLFLEYTFLKLEKSLHETIRQQKQIRASDI